MPIASMATDLLHFLFGVQVEVMNGLILKDLCNRSDSLTGS